VLSDSIGSMPEHDANQEFPEIEAVLSVIQEATNKLEPQTEPLVTLDLISHVPLGLVTPKDSE
jgi:hypothetical protein